MVSVSPATSGLVLPRCAGRTMTEALAATTALPAVPSATETLHAKVSTPEMPPGAVETLVASTATPTSV